jgi:hypothetical protein
MSRFAEQPRGGGADLVDVAGLGPAPSRATASAELSWLWDS